MNLPALAFAFSLAVLAAIHVNLYRRHRRAVATLQRVRRERDEASAKLWLAECLARGDAARLARLAGFEAAHQVALARLEQVHRDNPRRMG